MSVLLRLTIQSADVYGLVTYATLSHWQ